MIRLKLLIGFVSMITAVLSCRPVRPMQETIFPSTDTAQRQQRVADLRAMRADRFEAMVFKGDGAQLPYRLLRPQEGSGKKFPLLIIFHGSGAVGTDNQKQVGILANYFADPVNRAAFPAFVIVPQFPSRSSNYTMDSTRGVLSSVMQPPANLALALIDQYRKRPDIDSNRVYVIGFSMGGSTTVNVVSRHPEWFAGAVSISGIPEFAAIPALATFPLTLIHGTADTENPIDSDRRFFREISAIKGNKTRLIEFSGLEHNDMQMELVTRRDWANWLFDQKK